jgi:predicted metal-dependent hydrolase
MGKRKLSVAIRKYNKKMNSLSVLESEKLKSVEQLAKELMEIHKVSHYKFRFGYGWTNWGTCTSTTITLQLEFVLKNNMCEIKNTLLHEIAHAVVGIKYGHRIEWQLKAKELGVKFHKNYHK